MNKRSYKAIKTARRGGVSLKDAIEGTLSYAEEQYAIDEYVMSIAEMVRDVMRQTGSQDWAMISKAIRSELDKRGWRKVDMSKQRMKEWETQKQWGNHE